MATRKVSVERYVEQVRDGSYYRGHLKIVDTELKYELVFAIPIDRLDGMVEPTDVNELRLLFQITLKRGDVEIELTNKEYGFFFSMVVEFSVDFYNHKQTRYNNKGMMGGLLQGRGQMAAFGASTLIGMTSSGSYDFPLELCEMLSAPKFGCALVA
jgi:hypothetical protein